MQYRIASQSLVVLKNDENKTIKTVPNGILLSEDEEQFNTVPARGAECERESEVTELCVRTHMQRQEVQPPTQKKVR